ncbi:MAG TPA: hypothetical protein VH590_12315 [Ktedonobacterales bacterium]|jgi:hypothetical protein
MSASAVASRAPVRSPARASARRPARPAPPQKPADFFTQEARALLADLLASRAQQWQMDSAPPVYYYARDSVPLWGDYARHRCSGTTLRAVGRWLLCESLCVDLERGLRLLTLPWTPQGTTTDGHEPEEWHAALAGVCWRIGQLFRELARRQGEGQAREVLRLAMDTLWR